MNDMLKTIVPKSDQLNADDLIGRDLTITITGVEIRGGQEQPVSIHFEGDSGKPYKACKSMCRVMVSAWGADASKYVGRSMTLYRDPKVKWGGMEVGGIRISHMSDIADDMTMALTVTRANKKPYTVRPLVLKPGQAARKPSAPVPSLPGSDAEPPSAASQPAAEPVIEVISEAQLLAIENRMELGGISPARLSAKLLVTGVKSLAELPASKFQSVIDWIEKAEKKA